MKALEFAGILRKDCPYLKSCYTVCGPNSTERQLMHQNCYICSLLQEMLAKLEATSR